jgi:membrane protein
MLSQRVTQFLHWIRTLVTEPHTELTRWERALRYAYELCLHGWRALNRDDAPQMAAALAYRTLFALLPVVIVSSIVLRGQSTAQMEGFFASVIDATGLDQVRLTVPSVPGKTPEQVKAERAAEKEGAQSPPSTVGVNVASGSAGNAGPKTVSLVEFLQDLLRQAATLDLAALGWVGFFVVVYSAISLMVTIENSFNKVFGAPEGRYWIRRIPMYWLVLTLGPALVVGTIYVDRRFGALIDSVHTWSWALTIVKSVWGLCVVWVLMFFIYKLLPNTKVQNKAALAGAFVAALLLSAGKIGLGAYFANAVSFSSLYGALGAIPLFMFWVYLMWLAVLFGLEVAATVQMLQGRQIEELTEKQPQNGLVDPVQVVSVMEIISERFAHGLPTPTRDISDQTCIAENLVVTMVDRLVRANVLHRVEGAEQSVTLARPPDQISADRLLEIGYALVDEGGVGRVSMMVGRLREVQRRLASEATLASLLAAARPDGGFEPAS